MLYDKVEVTAIRLAMDNVGNHDISPKDVLLKSVCWLLELYEREKMDIYLKKAVWNIYAYLELGFLYEEGEIIFEKILFYLKKEKEDVFPKEKRNIKKIKVTKTNIRNLLGNWNPVYHSMCIADVVNDIYEKIVNCREGTYIYHSGKILENNDEKSLWQNTFRLIIDSKDTTFYDVNKNKYFLFERKNK